MIARLYLSNSAEIVLNMMASLPGNRNPMADERSQSEIQFAILPSVTPPTDSRKMEGTLARRSDSNEANLMTHLGIGMCSNWNQRKDAQQIAAADRHQHHKHETNNVLNRAGGWAPRSTPIKLVSGDPRLCGQSRSLN